MKASLYCWLCQWHRHWQSVFDLARFCEGFFSPRKKFYIHSLKLSLVVFQVLWCCNAFLLFYECTRFLIWPVSAISLISLGFFFKPNDDLFHLLQCLFGLHVKSCQEQLPDANLTQRVNFRPFIILICYAQGNKSRLAMKLLISQVSNYVWACEVVR